jgi:ABC-2 type transport system ATP-binding protein
MASLLAVKDLIIQYDGKVAVNGISFEVQQGEIFGLLGPNGAGKTSTLAAIEGLLKPQSGAVHVSGFDTTTDPFEARANMGLQLQVTSFQQDLFVIEIVELYAVLYGLVLSKEAIVMKLIEIGLSDHAYTRANQLSGGQLQRLSLLIATLHNPAIVLLDEPTTGLDPQSRRTLWKRIEALRASGRSVLLTTHSMEEASAICDRVAIMDHGSIIVIDNPQALVEKYKNDDRVKIHVRHGHATLEDVFIGLTGESVRA